MRHLRLFTIACLALVLPLHGQQTHRPAPVPNQILNAKRVFIANAPPTHIDFSQTIYSGGRYRAYDEFYAAMKSWGTFQLVDAPRNADLVFEVAQNSSDLQLIIVDSQSRVPLWWFHELLSMGTHRKDSDDLYDRAMAKLIRDVQDLVSAPSAKAGPPTESSQLPVPVRQKP